MECAGPIDTSSTATILPRNEKKTRLVFTAFDNKVKSKSEGNSWKFFIRLRWWLENGQLWFVVSATYPSSNIPDDYFFHVSLKDFH